MAKTKPKEKTSIQRTIKPAETPEARESQLVSLAINLAEKQLVEGTASSQVITHYLKMGSRREKLENEIKEKQKDLISAKTEAMHSSKRIEEMYADALNAMKSYSGTNVNDDYEHEEYDD